MTVAAFGPRAVEIAAAADRMVLNMVTVEAAARLAARHPNTAAWLAAAVDPTPEERRWLTLGYVGYLAAPGYGEMFADAGFGELVAFARTRPHPRRARRGGSPTSCSTPWPSSDRRQQVRQRIEAYAAAGLTEIGLVVPPLDYPVRPPDPRDPGPRHFLIRVFAAEPSVCCGTRRSSTRWQRTGRSQGGGVDGLVEEEATEGLVELRGDLQVLGRDVGVAQAALEHARRCRRSSRRRG